MRKKAKMRNASILKRRPRRRNCWARNRKEKRPRISLRGRGRVSTEFVRTSRIRRSADGYRISAFSKSRSVLSAHSGAASGDGLPVARTQAQDDDQVSRPPPREACDAELENALAAPGPGAPPRRPLLRYRGARAPAERDRGGIHFHGRRGHYACARCLRIDEYAGYAHPCGSGETRRDERGACAEDGRVLELQPPRLCEAGHCGLCTETQERQARTFHFRGAFVHDVPAHAGLRFSA